MCWKRGHFARDCWYQAGRGGGKGKKGKKGKRGEAKGTTSKDGDTKKKGPCHNCNEVGRFARDCRKKKASTHSNSSGGFDVHCLTYTDDQSQWIMMLAEIDHVCESSGDVELLVDSGAACRAWPCKVKPGSSQAGTFLAATGTPIESQGTKEVNILLFDLHCEIIIVTACV